MPRFHRYATGAVALYEASTKTFFAFVSGNAKRVELIKIGKNKTKRSAFNRGMWPRVDGEFRQSLTCNRKSKLEHESRQIVKSSNYIMYTQIFNILQGFELQVSCLNLECGRTANLLDVLKKYKILGFCGLGLNRLKSY